jgi:REP-associated tyrosine transposase
MRHRERKATRLHSYDYSFPGAYFITACTKNREFLFDTPEAKLAVVSAWHSLLDIFVQIELDEFVVMPNHVHGVIWIRGTGYYRLHPGTWKNYGVHRDGQLPIPTNDHTKFVSLSNIIGAFKTTAATRVNKLRGTVGIPVWQKSFYDRIIRNDHELGCIQEYIRNNPVKWTEDRDNPICPEFGPPVKSVNDYWIEIFDVPM